MQLDTPSPGMAGPLHDLSRTVPAHRAPSSIWTPVHEGYMQVEARLRELERKEQTMVDTTSFSATEQAMQQ